MELTYDLRARRELKEAAAWYEKERPGLGQEFLQEIERSVGEIVQAPTRWPKVGKRTRRCTVKRFPYGIMYVPIEDRLVVVAFAHVKRRPGYWHSRLEGEP